jgi:hypothetical protein
MTVPITDPVPPITSLAGSNVAAVGLERPGRDGGCRRRCAAEAERRAEFDGAWITAALRPTERLRGIALTRHAMMTTLSNIRYGGRPDSSS